MINDSATLNKYQEENRTTSSSSANMLSKKIFFVSHISLDRFHLIYDS